jgi:hypothetical protein
MRVSGFGDTVGYANQREFKMSNHKHGYFGTPTYRSWESMKRRCNNPKSNRYHVYGGRGITYDPRWEDFCAFLLDMGERPEGRTLERNNCNLPYDKDNCCWATAEEQANNTRHNVTLTFQGKTQTISQWTRELGFPVGVISMRLNRLGWSIEEALTVIPKRGNNQLVRA